MDEAERREVARVASYFTPEQPLIVPSYLMKRVRALGLDDAIMARMVEQQPLPMMGEL